MLGIHSELNLRGCVMGFAAQSLCDTPVRLVINPVDDWIKVSTIMLAKLMESNKVILLRLTSQTGLLDFI